MGTAIVWLVNAIVNLLIIAIFAQFIINLLITFDIINTRNRVVWQLKQFFDAVVQPMLRPFQRVVPILGGVDLSGLVLLLTIYFLQIVFNRLLAPPLMGLFG